MPSSVSADQPRGAFGIAHAQAADELAVLVVRAHQDLLGVGDSAMRSPIWPWTSVIAVTSLG